MPSFKSPDLSERLSRAADAKKTLLQKFKKAPGPGDAAWEQKAAERKVVAEARAAREAERLAAKKVRDAEQKRLAEIEAARVAKEKAEFEELLKLEAIERAEAEERLKAEQKSKRDARYAARKAAKLERRRGY